MKNVKHWIVATALMVSVTACMNNSDSDPESTDSQDISVTESSPAASWSYADGLTLDDATASEVSIAADCAFIEWCDRPASITPDIGTVCRVRTGCALTQAVVNECTAEANNTCGGMVQPSFICRQGAACP